MNNTYKLNLEADGSRKEYHTDDKAQPIKFHLTRVPLSGAYDHKGAYWGIGKPLYCAEYESDSSDQYVRLFIRGWNRAEAKNEIIKRYPAAKFYR